MKVETLLCSATAIAVFLQSVPSYAADDVQEIVVTARKRAESIMKVPVVETAVTADTMKQFATNDIKDMEALVPALQVGTGILDYGSQVSIRGVGNVTLNATVDQAVSLNLDGLQVNQGLAYSAGMFDLHEAEVLEGPQALFYGKSATGGVISLRSNDPTNETEIVLQGAYEPVAVQRRGEIIVSGPVTDTLKLRLAAQYSDEDGYFRNVAQGIPALGGLTPRFKDVSPDAQTLIRGTALWNPSDQFDFRLKVNYSSEDIDGNDADAEFVTCPGGLAGVPGSPTLQFLNPNGSCSVGKNLSVVDMNPAAFPGIPNGGTPFNDTWEAYGTLEANYYINPALTLTSVTGIFKLGEHDDFNATYTGAGGPLFAFEGWFNQFEFSEEMRLNSSFDGPVNFTAGVFYQTGQSEQKQNSIINSAPAFVNAVDGLFGLPAGIPLFPQYFQRGYFLIDNDDVSPFAQVRYKVLPELELDAGARWSDEWKHLTEINTAAPGTALNPGPTVPIGPVATGVPNISSYHLNPEFTVNYTPMPDLTLYGSYKEAAKSGSFHTSILEAPGTDLSFQDEVAKGGEIGAKGYLFNHHVRLTFDSYDYNYTNLQVGENIQVGQTLVVKTINAGTANVKGLEGAVNYLPEFVDGLTLRGAFDFNRGRFQTFNNAPCWGGQTAAQGCNIITTSSGGGTSLTQSLNGRPLLRAPDWTLNFGFVYDRPVFDNMEFTVASNTSFSSSYYTDLPERSDMIQKSFFKTDLSLTLHGPNDGWELALIGRDLNDELVRSSCNNSNYKYGVLVSSSPALPDGLACNIDPGREVWLQLTLRPLALLHS